ncbi:hypothetical protein ABVF61_01605 [Roseibium sp. HPY-6]|uniref:hypothetical protein n=1 Tax=Roseibium sp. HPY-6 TaxID=3229852 RepID=UPI00339052A5
MLQSLVMCCAITIVFWPATASADCKADISKVEYAIDHAKRVGIEVTTAERMRALLQDANKERKAGNEQKCQELINEAKNMGNVE